MLDREMLKTMTVRQIPASTGSAGAVTYSIVLSPTATSSTTTGAGANAAYTDSQEAGRELTLVDTGMTFANHIGRFVLINSGALSGKVFQIVYGLTTTATLRYESTDASSTIASGVSYTILPDYTEGSKLLVLGVREYNRGATTAEQGVILRILQNGGTTMSFLMKSTTANTMPDGNSMASEFPILIDTSRGAPTIQFQKGPTIGTTTWISTVRWYVSMVKMD